MSNKVAELNWFGCDLVMANFIPESSNCKKATKANVVLKQSKLEKPFLLKKTLVVDGIDPHLKVTMIATISD